MMSLDLGSLTVFDGIVLFVIIVSAILSTLRGLTREFLGLAGWFIAIGIAQLTSPVVEEWLANYITVPEVNEILGWLIPFIIAIILWFILASIISPGLSRAGLGALDRWFGILFGIARGFVLICLVYGGIVIFVQEEKIMPSWVTESKSAFAIRYAIGVFQPLLPASIQDNLSSLDIPSQSEETRKNLTDNPVTDAAQKANELNLLDDEK